MLYTAVRKVKDCFTVPRERIGCGSCFTKEKGERECTDVVTWRIFE